MFDDCRRAPPPDVEDDSVEGPVVVVPHRTESFFNGQPRVGHSFEHLWIIGGVRQLFANTTTNLEQQMFNSDRFQSAEKNLTFSLSLAFHSKLHQAVLGNNTLKLVLNYHQTDSDEIYESPVVVDTEFRLSIVDKSGTQHYTKGTVELDFNIVKKIKIPFLSSYSVAIFARFRS